MNLYQSLVRHRLVETQNPGKTSLPSKGVTRVPGRTYVEPVVPLDMSIDVVRFSFSKSSTITFRLEQSTSSF